jgi:hypothetical protein
MYGVGTRVAASELTGNTITTVSAATNASTTLVRRYFLRPKMLATIHRSGRLVNGSGLPPSQVFAG